jgi:hypothetical protein
VLIRQENQDDRIIFSLDIQSPLIKSAIEFEPSIESNIDKIIRARPTAFNDSAYTKELLDFLHKVKGKTSGINYNFKYLRPGKMLADHSNFKWE